MKADDDKLKLVAERWVLVQPALMGIISASVRNRHDAEDVLQNTARAIIMAADRYDEARSFRGWAIGITRNCILQYYDTKKRQQLILNSAMLDMVIAVVEDDMEDNAERREALRLCIGRLKGKGRVIVEMKYSKGLKCSQIADELGMKTPTVRVALHRARTFLRECVARQLGPESAYSRGDVLE